ncbi:substrate-binding periplasmic protein [Salidesulfovibrio brasiliensis]|uniref:substrate-binding periplasmic protein n=1 Tax=Salidesulfovibrio brasiliensis TaxID=221711 RepID=UPI0006CF26C3|nr:ABC transporter substrate-binding protein [Salidesulfovibrio brasiliensis]
MREAIVGLLVMMCLLVAGNSSALTIVVEETTPAVFYGQDGRLTGIFVDVIEELKRRTGEDASIEVVPWARAYRIAREQPDTLLAPTTRTADREHMFFWLGPIITQKWAIYGLEGRAPLTSMEEARTLRSIGVVRGDARAEFLRGQGFTNLVEVKAGELNVVKLKARRIEAMVSSNIGIAGFSFVEDVSASGIVPLLTLKEVGLYLAFSQGSDPVMVDKWRTALNSMRRDGTFQRIHEKWLPGQPLPVR